jgi:hypothetical protein
MVLFSSGSIGTWSIAPHEKAASVDGAAVTVCNINITVNAVVASVYSSRGPVKPVYQYIFVPIGSTTTVPPHRYLTCDRALHLPVASFLPVGSKLQKDAMKDFADKDNAKR